MITTPYYYYYYYHSYYYYYYCDYLPLLRVSAGASKVPLVAFSDVSRGSWYP